MPHIMISALFNSKLLKFTNICIESYILTIIKLKVLPKWYPSFKENVALNANHI